MTAELVSVVIPCHDAGDFIRDTLANVLAQREPGNIEVEAIVVDDASSDGSVGEVEVAARDNPGAIRLLRQPTNRGPGAARNVGLRQARGRFVCFLDADDHYAPGFFARALEHFRQQPQLAAVVTDIELVNCHREVHPAQRRLMVLSLPSNLMLRTSVAELLGGFPEDEIFRGKAAGEDCALRMLLAKTFETHFDEGKYLRYLVKRGSHFDYFLDRTKVVDDRVVFLEQTAEELSPRYDEATRRYEERCRERLAMAAASSPAARPPSLQFDEIEEFELLRSRFADVDGFLHPAEGYALYQLAKAGPSTGKIVEIGSFMGLSTCWLATGTKVAGRRAVVAIDHFRGSPEHQPGGLHEVAAIAVTGSTFPIFKENITKKGVADCVETRIGSSAEVAAGWSEPVRLLFIDGDHSFEATRRDVEQWSRFLNDRGLMAFHNIGVWPGVTAFYDGLLADGAWREIASVHSLRVVRRAEDQGSFELLATGDRPQRRKDPERPAPASARLQPLARRIAVVSAADAGFFDLLQGMVRSLRDRQQGRDLPLYVFDLGLTEAQRAWLLLQGARLQQPDCGAVGTGLPAYLRAFLSRCRMPEIFPGHEIYLWIDADAWVQDWSAIDAYVEGAWRAGFAIVPESDPAYDRAAVLASHRASYAMFGAAATDVLLTTGPFNAGVFAGRADAPHWSAWQRLIAAHIDRAVDRNALFYLDQTALGLTCKDLAEQTRLLPATSNWLAHFALPMASDDGGTLLRPLSPHEPVGIVHQTATTKRAFFPLRRAGGGFLSRPLSYQARSQIAGDEYVSADLQVVLADQCFPNMVRGDQSASDWPHLRRGLPHAWLVDRRVPTWGFLNRDEVHILYNLALAFGGRPALEIGCLMGWSACHIAVAGPDLDIVDPLLANPDVYTSVTDSLQKSRFPGRVTLNPGRSPDAVHELAKTRPQGWSFFFIDGDHEGEAPLRDVQACEPYAAADCAMVFHDLASPHVTNAVLYLKEKGWQVRVYHTAQVMAVAWRGNVRPVAHQPDPRIDWQIPPHVMPLLA